MKRLIIILILIACFVAQADEESDYAAREAYEMAMEEMYEKKPEEGYTAEKQGSSMWFLVTIPTSEVKDQFDYDFSEFSIRKSQYARQSKPNTNDYCHCKIICEREFLTEQKKKKTTGGVIMTEAMKRTLIFYACGGLTSKDETIGYHPGANVEMKMYISCQTDYREVTEIQISHATNTIIIYVNGDYEVKENSND